jgi:predicted Fe-Mo cluster-binding NifX family protein
VRLCVSATGPDLDAEVDEEFGHCAYFVLVNPETMEFTAVKNQGANAEMGAGIYAAETVVKEGCDVVITGWVGPHGQKKLLANNIRIVMDEEGTVREAVERYKRKHLPPR